VGTPGAQPAWTRGNPNAAVTIEEFADFACPACASFHNVLKDIKNTYGDRVKITYRHFPLEIRGHENSYTASRATEAAGEQGKFWEMQDMIFTKQREWQFNPEAGKTYEEYAKTLGLDVAKFSDDMRGQKVIARIADDRKRGMAVPVSSTPTVLINGRLATQDEILKPELLKQAIDALLQKTAPAAAAPTAANTGSGAAANSAANANK
jgi:protein-disulfide isomerase